MLIPALVVLAARSSAAVLSPPGRAVFERVRQAVGVEHADPALFSLPAPGRLLVVSTDGGGVWLVRDNGFKRRLGAFADAQWSPHGLFAVATTRNHLLALDEDAHVRWTLARAGASLPRWAGTLTDTRIAYLAHSGLRVVAGDGRGDRLLDSTAAQVAPAWVPGRAFDLAYVSGSGTIVRRDATLGRRASGARQADLLPLSLEWSDDGRLLAVTSANRVVVLGADGRLVRTISVAERDPRHVGVPAAQPPARRLGATRVPERAEARRRRPSGSRAPAFRRPRHVRRRRLVAGRDDAARRLADGKPVGLPARVEGARCCEHPRGVPARRRCAAAPARRGSLVPLTSGDADCR